MVWCVSVREARERKILLPQSTTDILRERRKAAPSEWIFFNPLKPERSISPEAAYRRLKALLKQAGLPNIPFHNLRHTFVTRALASGVDTKTLSGMDVKTLSTIIGHVSAKTTLNIYTHVTDAMRQAAAAKIDRGIGKREPQDGSGQAGEDLPEKAPQTRPKAAFETYKGKIRKPGTGCVTQINDHLWEGRYSPKWPDGKKHPRNIYAHTESECEEKLAELIQQTKAEIAEPKRLAAEGKWGEVMVLVGQKKARGTRRVEADYQEKATTL